MEKFIKVASFIADKAEVKFGTVKAYRQNADGSVVLLIKRDEPARADRPYMTIRGHAEHTEASDWQVHFYFGNYDLTEDDAEADFKDRCKMNGTITKAPVAA